MEVHLWSLPEWSALMLGPTPLPSLFLSPSGVLLSMGFGFVEYKKPEQAQKALKQLQVRWGFWVPMVRPWPKKE